MALVQIPVVRATVTPVALPDRRVRLQVPVVVVEAVTAEAKNVKAAEAAEAAEAEVTLMPVIPVIPEAQVIPLLQTVFLFPQGVTLSRCPPEEL